MSSQMTDVETILLNDKPLDIEFGWLVCDWCNIRHPEHGLVETGELDAICYYEQWQRLTDTDMHLCGQCRVDVWRRARSDD